MEWTSRKDSVEYSWVDVFVLMDRFPVLFTLRSSGQITEALAGTFETMIGTFRIRW